MPISVGKASRAVANATITQAHANGTSSGTFMWPCYMFMLVYVGLGRPSTCELGGSCTLRGFCKRAADIVT